MFYSVKCLTEFATKRTQYLQITALDSKSMGSQFLKHLFLLLWLVLICVSSSQKDEPGQQNNWRNANDYAPIHSLHTHSERNEQQPQKKECTTNDDCLPLMTCNNSSNECQCCDKDFKDGIVKCDKGKLFVLDCYCVTSDNSTGQNVIVAGACVENCMNIDKDFYDNRYTKLDHNQINTNEVCDRFNRNGRLCGKCPPGLYPQAYSFDLTCVNCTEGNVNLWKFFLVVFAPITALYIIILSFKINATSSYLHGFVLFSQAVSLPVFCRLVFEAIKVHPKYTLSIKILISLYGFWNLDFFRMALPGICLDLSSPLSIVALDYVSALFYPLFLTILSYILIDLHERNFKPLVFIWKPFHCLFLLFRKHWDVRTSVIDAYATLYLLSFFKILSTSFDLLIPTLAFDMRNDNKTKYVLYYDGSVDYFGSEHLPYAIPALVICFLFVALPTLLLLIYPFRCFQYVLNRIHIRWHVLHTLMDSFQGCYKNGTEPGTRDCRSFAGLYLLGRIIMFVIFSFTHNNIFFPFAIFILLLLVILIVNVQPHRNEVSHYNKINATFLCLLALLFAAILSINIASIKARFFVKGCYILVLLTSLIPLVYISCIFVYWIIKQRRWGREFVNRARAWQKGYEELNESLPDRIENPEDYRNLEDTVNLHTEPETPTSITGIGYA